MDFDGVCVANQCSIISVPQLLHPHCILCSITITTPVVQLLLNFCRCPNTDHQRLNLQRSICRMYWVTVCSYSKHCWMCATIPSSLLLPQRTSTPLHMHTCAPCSTHPHLVKLHITNNAYYMYTTRTLRQPHLHTH